MSAELQTALTSTLIKDGQASVTYVTIWMYNKVNEMKWWKKALCSSHCILSTGTSSSVT